MRELLLRNKKEPPKRTGWITNPPPLTPSSSGLDSRLVQLVHETWKAFASFRDEPYIVKPSIPILFFGDSRRYFLSPLKVVTLGLNPSGVEFPEGDRFLRFAKVRNLDTRPQGEEFVRAYVDALDGYFQQPPNHPYKRWFNSFEPLLRGLDCSYYGAAVNTALHTDICSPFATDPTWSQLSSEVQARLMQLGTQQWHDLVDWLSPDLIIASVARSYLDRINFVRDAKWQVIHTIDRKNPYDVELCNLRLRDGQTARLIFGKAANIPFGTVSNEDKRKIGNELKRYINQARTESAPAPTITRNPEPAGVQISQRLGRAMSPIEEMAHGCYGYGSWDAPYWFIGLEEGMDGTLDARISAWRYLGAETGLSDCRAFHQQIGVGKWHQQDTKVALQSTWKQLIRLLLASRGESTDTETIRGYQVNEWGKAKGETCVIELFGLPAKGLKEGVTLREQHFTSEQVKDLLQKRTATIRQKVLEKRPKFVVMYGMMGKPHFERLAGQSLIRDQVVTLGTTKMVLTPHPVAQGSANADWVALGRKLGGR